MKKTNSKKGFTLVEMVIVIAVIAILAAILVPTFSSVINSANETKAKADLKSTITTYLAENAQKGNDISVDGNYFVKGNDTFKYNHGEVIKCKDNGTLKTDVTPTPVGEYSMYIAGNYSTVPAEETT